MFVPPIPATAAEVLELLVRDRVIAVATAEDLKQRFQSDSVPLGKILRQKGYLTMKQLIELLQLKAERPGRRLGELAIERGLCTQAQIEDALRVQQRASTRQLLDLLADDVRCDARRLSAFLIRYVEERIERAP